MGILQARILEWAAISYSGDLPDLGIEPASPVSPALASGFFTTEPPGNTCITICIYKYDYICIKL